MVTVERIERPSVAHFRRHYLSRRRPVVIVGANDHWRARAWTVDGLAQRIGDRLVQANLLKNGHVRVDPDSGLSCETMTFRTFLARLDRAVPPEYSLRLELIGENSDLRDDFEIPPYCLGSISPKLEKVSLWVAAKGAVTDTHYDMFHNIAAQLRGTRRITLFSPSDSKRLYPYSRRTLHFHHSQVRLDAPDLTAFPSFRDAVPLRVDLAPGEMLFIPRGWWHHFEVMEPSIAVNFFWLTPRLVPAIAVSRALWVMSQVRT